jgi:uncharacterized membrane protein YraQ (UPF0718 family)
MSDFARQHPATGSAPPPDRSKKPRLIDGSLLFFIALAAVASIAVLVLQGSAALQGALTSSLWLLVSITPMIVLGLYLGGLTRELADPKRIAPVLGESSGWLGLVLASALGAITPGGPFAAFPIVYALFLAGADIGAVIAYLTAWSVLALHRVVVWEIPLLGIDFALIRLLSSLPLPILAGALARIIAKGPLKIERPGRPPPAGGE